MASKLERDIESIYNYIKRQLRDSNNNNRNRNLYIDTEVVLNIKKKNGETVQHTIRDNTLQSHKKVILGDIKGSIRKHIEEVMDQPDRIAGSHTNEKKYDHINIKLYYQ